MVHYIWWFNRGKSTLPTIDDSDWVLTDDSAISLNGIELQAQSHNGQ